MNIKQALLTLASTLGTLAIVTTATYAIGTLTPGDTPGENTQVSLNDIYNKILNINATPGVKTAPDFNDPQPSFNTLSEIYALLGTEQAKVIEGNIRSGVEIFGVQGEYTGPELEWSSEQGPLSWTDATLACSTLDEGGVPVGTWRLPTRYELEAAIAEDWSDGNGTRFADSMNYWSGTENGSDNAWNALWFGNVYSHNVGKSNAYRVRCVR